VIPASFDKKQAQELVEDIENDLYRLAHVYVDLEKSRKLLEEWIVPTISTTNSSKPLPRSFMVSTPALRNL